MNAPLDINYLGVWVYMCIFDVLYVRHAFDKHSQMQTYDYSVSFRLQPKSVNSSLSLSLRLPHPLSTVCALKHYMHLCLSLPLLLPQSMFHFHSHKFAKCSMAHRVVATRQHVSRIHTQMKCFVYGDFCTEPSATPSVHMHIQLMQYHTPQTTHRMLWYLSPLRRICVFAILPFWLSKCLCMLPSSLLLAFFVCVEFAINKHALYRTAHNECFWKCFKNQKL